MRILVTGGAGYIGSVVTEVLLDGGHEVVVVDDLSKGHRSAVDPRAAFVRGDVGDREVVTEVLRAHGVEAVVHMAASSLVGESVLDPHQYFRNNVVAGNALLGAMLDCRVKRIVFSSTAAVYGEPEKVPIEEDGPTAPSNPYGESKLQFERALAWYDRAYGLRYASLRYFNAAGATERCGEWHDPETHLIPIVLQAAAGRRAHVTVFGRDYATPDGTCVRDYLHVADLAAAHVLALEALDTRSRIYNLGNGDGHSVREVIEAARKATERPIATVDGDRRAGDPAVLVASSERIRAELGWRARTPDLREIVTSAWRWMRAHPDGYPTDGEDLRSPQQSASPIDVRTSALEDGRALYYYSPDAEEGGDV
jgi:UDP-glucose 4-epimerase